jgi:hypothetical protein
MNAAWLHNALGNRLGRVDPEIQVLADLHRKRARQLGIDEDPSSHFSSAQPLDATYGYVREFLFVPRREFKVTRGRETWERTARSLALFRLAVGTVEFALKRARPGRGSQHDPEAMAVVGAQVLTAFQRAAGQVVPDPWADTTLVAQCEWKGDELRMWWGAVDAPVRALEPLDASTGGPPTPVASQHWDRA